MRFMLCFIPPVAVLLCGKPAQAILSIGLTCLGYIPGVIHAFAVVASHKADKRNQKLINAIKG